MFISILAIATAIQVAPTFSFVVLLPRQEQMRTQQLIITLPWKTTMQLIHSPAHALLRTPTFLQREKSAVNGEESATPAFVMSNINEKVEQSVSGTFSNSTDNISPIAIATVSAKPFVKKKLQTYLRYLEVECWKRSDLRGLEPVLQAVASACKQITRIVQRAQTDDVYGVALDVHGNPLCEMNVQGEVQQKLDVLCNTIMLQAFCGSGREIHAVASEEEDEPRCCSNVMVSCSLCYGSYF